MNPDRFGVVACVVPLRIGDDDRIVGEAHVDREGRVTATVVDPAAVRMLMQEAPDFSLKLMVWPEAIERMYGTHLLTDKPARSSGSRSYTDLRSAPGYQVGFFEGDNDWRWRSANAAGFGFKTEAEAIAAAQDHYRSAVRLTGAISWEGIRPTCGECRGAGITAEETTSPEGAPAIVEDTCGRCRGEGVEPAPLGFKVPTVDEAALASARWLGDTLVTPEVDPADLEGRRARVEPIPPEIKTRIALDELFQHLERLGLISGREHDECADHQLINKVGEKIDALLERARLGADTIVQIGEFTGDEHRDICSPVYAVAAARKLRERAEKAERALAALRRDKHDEVYEVAGQEFALPSDVVAELKGAAPLLLEQADAELLVALRAAAGAFARVRELEAGITEALDHLGSAREEDSLDRREQYRAEAERALQGVL